MVVFVEDAAQSLSSADVQVGDLGLVGDRWWQRVQWSCVGDALVGSVRVVELFVLPQSAEQMSLVPDQSAIEEFVVAALDPSLHDRVHPWDPDTGEDNLDGRIGEDGVEQGGELSVRQ
jgi:hypothetical protein